MTTLKIGTLMVALAMTAACKSSEGGGGGGGSGGGGSGDLTTIEELCAKCQGTDAEFQSCLAHVYPDKNEYVNAGCGAPWQALIECIADDQINCKEGLPQAGPACKEASDALFECNPD